MRKLVLVGIKLYQGTGFLRKPFLKMIVGTEGACRFTPTCSEYTYQAVQKYGVVKGLYLGTRRVSRCHPWSKGGNDPLK